MEAADTRPNFVLFIADDISWDDLGCYGHPTLRHRTSIHWPIGRAAIHQRLPDHQQLQSQPLQHHHGPLSAQHGRRELHTALPEGTVLFPTLLKEAGYYTVLSGKHHMGMRPTGFRVISKGKGPGQGRRLGRDSAAASAGQTVLLLVRLHRRPPRVGLSTTMRRSTHPRMRVPPYLVDGPQTREDLTGYYHEVSRFDHFVGKVVEELKRRAIARQHLIIVMADNGRPFPRCKTRLYDNGIKTPFVVHYPKGATSRQ